MSDWEAAFSVVIDNVFRTVTCIYVVRSMLYVYYHYIDIVLSYIFYRMQKYNPFVLNSRGEVYHIRIAAVNFYSPSLTNLSHL